jgi:hypothetical protein
MEQRTPEWFAKRLGLVTASRIADVMAKVTKKEAAIKDGSFTVKIDDNEPKSL